jgi:hypothetical protein
MSTPSPAGGRPRPSIAGRTAPAVAVIALLFGASLAAEAQAPTSSSARSSDRCVPTLKVRAAGGHQVADNSFNPKLPPPAYPAGTGPLVLVDEAHHNFHTTTGRYAPFAKVLGADGYVVAPLRERLGAAPLARARVLVIANALAERNAGGDWTTPTPSAFEPDEIAALRRWVEDGGSLFLIADHMPFGGAVEDLGAAFGLMLTNGYATDAACGADEFLFTRDSGTLADHPITRGRTPAERVTEVRNFTGQAFRAAPGTAPLLTLAPETVLLFPLKAWDFSVATPRMPADGMLQGAALVAGRGRVAAFGDAAMFSAQVSGTIRRPMGMNDPNAPQNAQFLLNVMHWLTGLLPAQ